MLDALPAHLTYCDPEYRVRFANAAFADFVGRDVGEVIGRHIRELLGDELFNLNEPYARRALAGEPQQFDRVVSDAAGRTRRLQATFTPHMVGSQVDGFFVFVRDIGARDELERRLASEATYHRAFLASEVAKATLDGAGMVLESNPALGRLLGIDADVLVGHGLVELFPESERETERARIDALFVGGLAEATVERMLRRGDGELRWVIYSLALAEGDGVAPAFGIAQFQDISERKAVEDELRRSRERLTEAEQIARIGSWDLDLATRRSRWSPGIARIFGLDPVELEADHDQTVAELVYSEDRAFVISTLERAVDERTPFTIEYRVVRPDGRMRTLSVRGDVVVDENGRAVRLVGVAQDITETKLTHDVLQRASAELEKRARELESLARAQHPEEAPAAVGASLTARQLEILQLVAEGLTNAAIARRLFISEPTVKWHLRETLRKTGCSNRAEAVARVFGAQPRD